jgi:hypothetical protein
LVAELRFRDAGRGASTLRERAPTGRARRDRIVTWLDRVAFCVQMRNALLVVILLGTAACGAYRFPGPGGSSGTVSGQVIASTCGPVGPVAQPCFKGPGPADCPPQNPTADTAGTCGSWPVPGLELFFTSGDTSRIAKTDSNGYYAIELPSGTWTVSTRSFMRIISGPETLVVKAGANIIADYIVDTGIRAGALPGSEGSAPTRIVTDPSG